nr:organic cation transporter protein-like [Onthophagus taurus]
MDFDDILLELGEMGAYQIKIYLLICLPIIFSAANSLTYVFVAGIPNYRCLIPNCEDASTAEYKADFLQMAIPNSIDNPSDKYVPTQCTRFELNGTFPNDTCVEQAFLRNLVEKCDKWVFDNERTVVNDFGITCLENEWKLSLAGGAHFLGILIGSAVFGFLADKFGRKLIFIFCIIFMSVTGVLQSISPNYPFFLILLFANAFGTAGVYPLAFILGVELVGRSKREITAIVLNYFYAVGEALVGLFAWVYQDWVPLQLTASGPCLVFLCYYWLIPESVRWLLAKNRKLKAKEIVIEAAKFNQVDLSEMIMMSFETDQINPDVAPPQKVEKSPWIMIKYIFKSKKLVVRFIIIIIVWTVNAFVYYGLSINSVNISGNKYLNFSLVCLIEIPGYTLSWISMSKFGRKPTLVISFLLCGLTCAANIIPSGITWIEVTLFLIGKLSITSSFGVVYCHTAEMLPTVIRSGGVGTASTTARIGSTLAPFVPLIGKYVQVLPMILFAGVSILAGLLSLKLPETLGSKLPETIEEADNL